MANGLTLKLPVTKDELDWLKLIKNFPDLVEQNLTNLLLTLPGERVMDPTFGVGIARYLFEQNDKTTYADIRSKIKEQVAKYLPFVQINKIAFSNADIKNPDGFLANPGKSLNPNLLGIQITYTIVPLKATRNLKL